MMDLPPAGQQENGEAAEGPSGARPLDQATFFQRLFGAEYSYVFNSLRRLGARPADVEDLAQEVFVTAYRRLSDYDRTRPVRPWLFGIAFRVVAQSRRSVRRNRELSGMDTAEPADDESVGAQDWIEKQEDRRMVLEALSSVELDRRAVLLMHDLDGVPAPEIASTLAIPLNTAYSRLRLARQEFSSAVKRLRLRRGER